MVVAVLAVRVGPGTLADMLGRIGWSFLAVSLVYTAHVGVRAVALWRSIVEHPLRFTEVLRVRFAGETVEVLTSTGPFLAEPSKAWLLARRGLPIASAYAGVATEYLLYTTVSAVLAVVAISQLIAHGLGGRSHGTVLAVFITVLFLGVVAFASLTGIGAIVPMVRASGAIIGRTRVARVIAVVEPVERELVSFLHGQPRRMLEVLSLELAAHALLLSEVWIVVRALRLPFVGTDLLIIEGGSKVIASAFFFIPGQVGAFETVYVALFGAIGLPAAAGLTLALVRRARALLVAAVSLAVLTCVSEPDVR